MSDVANTVWARALVDELARAGLTEAVIAPGSRSTPLVMALARDDRVRVRVHLDERSAAFFALGAGRASGRPVAVVTTSGTAVANVFPAVIEASQSGVPLLVLSADRPPRLRGADANQAIDQVRIFGSYPRAFHDLAVPTLDGPALRHLRSVAGRAYAAAVGADPGPVHLNVPFDKPLEPREVDPAFDREHPVAAAGRSNGAPYTRIVASRPRLSDGELDDALGGLDPARGVIVAGPVRGRGADGSALVEFAAATGMPLLADPLSGARYRPDAGALRVATYDLLLRDGEVRERLAPSLIVRVGAAPTSAAVGQWLLDHRGVEQVVVGGVGRWTDHGATATRYLEADPTETLRRMGARWSSASYGSGSGSVEPSWTEAWRRADEAAREAIAERREAWSADRASGAASVGPNEGEVVADVLAALPEGAALFVSSSMPVRDLDAYGHPMDRRVDVFGNRGASGIDGIVSSAFGVASQREGSTVCVLGDVAYFHDRNGLLWSRESDAAVVFVLVDNDGGGIFHMLPIADHEPEFTRYFATPHGVDPRPVAEAHGVAYDEVETGAVGAAVSEALARTTASGVSAVLRVRTDRAENRRLRAEVAEAVARSVRAALG